MLYDKTISYSIWIWNLFERNKEENYIIESKKQQQRLMILNLWEILFLVILWKRTITNQIIFFYIWNSYKSIQIAIYRLTKITQCHLKSLVQIVAAAQKQLQQKKWIKNCHPKIKIYQPVLRY